MHQETYTPTKGTLYVVATPIGNLRDITFRALDVLGQVDLVAAEDTRNTRNLLQHFSLSAQLMAVHEHNERGAAEKLIAALKAGRSVALVSDAGTPGISDPGAVVVKQVREAGFPVVPVPGASAAACALSAAGLENSHFLFYGFLPAKGGSRRRELEALKQLPYTLVFYEAPHRIVESVKDMAVVFGGERPLILARELTKLFEQIHACPLGEAESWLLADANRQKGEFVLLLSGAPAGAEGGAEEAGKRTLELLLAELPLKQAVKLAAEISGRKKNELYALALRLKGEQEAGGQ